MTIRNVLLTVSLLCLCGEALADNTYILATGRRDPRMYAIDLKEALKPQNNDTPNAIVSRSKTALDRLDGKLLGDPANIVISEDGKTAYVVNHHENALKAGLVPIALPPSEHERLAHEATRAALTVSVDVAMQTVALPEPPLIRFALDSRSQARLLRGIDEVDETLTRRARIEQFRIAQRAQYPWLDVVDTDAAHP